MIGIGDRWEENYKRIQQQFNFITLKSDTDARDILFSILNTPKSELKFNLEEDYSNKLLYFFGAGPNLTSHVTSLLTDPKTLDSNLLDLVKNRDEIVIICADGSTHALLERGIIPDFIFTDLDGFSAKDLLAISENLEKGGNKEKTNILTVVIHAHGDNTGELKKIKKISDILQNRFVNIIGTSQVAPKPPIMNFGGFTDGDRSALFFHHFLQLPIPFYFFGYQLGEDAQIGKYSKFIFKKPQEMTPIKRKKLDLCLKFLDILKEDGRMLHFF